MKQQWFRVVCVVIATALLFASLAATSPAMAAASACATQVCEIGGRTCFCCLNNPPEPEGPCFPCGTWNCFGV